MAMGRNFDDTSGWRRPIWSRVQSSARILALLRRSLRPPPEAGNPPPAKATGRVAAFSTAPIIPVRASASNSSIP